MSLSKKIQPKRGYLANYLTIPPLIYPFQYNPTQVSDTKRLEYEKRPKSKESDKIGGKLLALRELVGSTYSKADMMQFKSEGARTLNFKFIIDGREKQPGEPQRRRDDGTILPDLAILRSFVYPGAGDVLDILKAAYGDKEKNWTNIWFNKPPTAILILGDMSVEGFVTDLKITETMFNSYLDPVRAEVEISMIENTDSISFIIDSVKRLSRTYYHTAYEDIGKVIIPWG